jgi:hypothetical protein
MFWKNILKKDFVLFRLGRRSTRAILRSSVIGPPPGAGTCRRSNAGCATLQSRPAPSLSRRPLTACWAAGGGGGGQLTVLSLGGPAGQQISPSTEHTDKKENKIFLIYKEIQMGSGVKSYMRRKGFLIYEEMRKFFPMYDFAPDPSEFPSIRGNFLFFFYQCSKKFKKLL